MGCREGDSEVEWGRKKRRMSKAAFFSLMFYERIW